MPALTNGHSFYANGLLCTCNAASLCCSSCCCCVVAALYVRYHAPHAPAHAPRHLSRPRPLFLPSNFALLPDKPRPHALPRPSPPIPPTPARSDSPLSSQKKPRPHALPRRSPPIPQNDNTLCFPALLPYQPQHWLRARPFALLRLLVFSPLSSLPPARTNALGLLSRPRKNPFTRTPSSQLPIPLPCLSLRLWQPIQPTPLLLPPTPALGSFFFSFTHSWAAVVS